MSRAYDPCTERYSDLYFNRPEVQKAFHANVTGIPYAWKACRYYLYATFWDFSWGLFCYLLWFWFKWFFLTVILLGTIGLILHYLCFLYIMNLSMLVSEYGYTGSCSFFLTSLTTIIVWHITFCFIFFFIIPFFFLPRIETHYVYIFGCSGDTDAIVPVTATRYSIDALKLPTIINWYPWYDSGKVGTTSIINKTKLVNSH